MPDNEQDRLARLHALEILDTPKEAAFDRAVRIASEIMGTPIALISLVDADRQWFKARLGLDAEETPRDVAFCAHAIVDGEPLIVPDATKDERFSDNPLVKGDPKIRFYAGAPLTTHDGLSLGTLCAIDRKPRDVTPSQVAALQDLADLVMDEMTLREVGRKTLTDLNRRLEFDNTVNSFITEVNHELRTPLTSIIGAARLLTQGIAGELPDEAMKLVKIADQNSKLMLELVNDLLDIAKLESNAIQYEFQSVDLSVLIAQTMESIRAVAEEKSVSLACQTLGEQFIVTGDEQRLLQIFINILSNAVKFSPDGGQIRIQIKAELSAITTRIEDEGPGIPPDQQDKIFEKFVQGDAARTVKAKGTGLGLSICRALVAAHGGSIGVESEPGHGACFVVSFPLTGR